MKKIIVKDLIGLKKIAETFFDDFKGYKFFAFFAEMGCGKTTFIKEIINSIEPELVVTSPTFSIVNEYLTNKGVIYHFDFYRINNISEVYDIGIEEYFYSNNYCFIEWSEKIETILPEKDIVFIYIKKLEDEKREITFSYKKL